MDKVEAKAVLSALLADYRATSYSELQHLLGTQDVMEVTADSGAEYQIEIQAIWDNKEYGNLRVMGLIDDGGIRAFFPLTDDFIMTPDGEFVGE